MAGQSTLALTPLPLRAPPRPTSAYPAVRMSKRRSEIDRRLEGLLRRESKKLRDHSKEGVFKVLRLFNLCDIAPRSTVVERPLRRPAQPAPAASPQAGQQPQPQASEERRPSSSGAAPAASLQSGDESLQRAGSGAAAMEVDGPGAADLLAVPPPQDGAEGDAALAAEQPPAQPQAPQLRPLLPLELGERESERESESRYRSRLRARLLDLGLLLDVVLDSTSDKVKRDFVDCGILTQLQGVLGRLPVGKEYSVLLVKVSWGCGSTGLPGAARGRCAAWRGQGREGGGDHAGQGRGGRLLV